MGRKLVDTLGRRKQQTSTFSPRSLVQKPRRHHRPRPPLRANRELAPTAPRLIHELIPRSLHTTGGATAGRREPAMAVPRRSHRPQTPKPDRVWVLFTVCGRDGGARRAWATATSERRDGFLRHRNLAQTGISGVQLFADCAAYGSEGAAANFWGSGSVVGIFPTSIPRPIRIMLVKVILFTRRHRVRKSMLDEGFFS